MSSETPFSSILFVDDVPLEQVDDVEQPEHFGDLNLDQLVDEMCSGHARAHLEPFFWIPLRTVDAVRYRQAAMRELEETEVNLVARRFVEGIDQVRQHQSLMTQVRYALQRQRCVLDAADAYCAAVRRLGEDLQTLDLRSSALERLRAYVRGYVHSAAFEALGEDVHRTRKAVESVTYRLHIRGNRIRVQPYERQPDLGAEVAELFARFREHGKPGDPVIYKGSGGFSHIDAAVLEQVAEVFPAEFGALTQFAEKNERFVDAVIARFGREAEFVLSCVEFQGRLTARGLPVCYPAVRDDGHLSVENCYDAALAAKSESTSIITNSLRLTGAQRIIVVTGPNQGGKTTIARTFGQLHYLTALGCAVPASDAEISLADQVFTQFERQEDPGSQRGKLQDELLRMRNILQTATSRSVIVLNEVFSSTATDDALRLAEKVLDEILALGCRAICVTFLDELADYHKNVISMVAEVDRTDPSVRTYRLTRRPADGRAYADAIARKYQLSRDEVKERVLG